MDEDGTCVYSTTVDGESWSCHRTSVDDADSCLFHLSPADRRSRGIDDATIQERFLAAVQSAGEHAKQFIGCRFGTLDLSYQDLDAPDNYPIDLRQATIQRFALIDAALAQPLQVDDGTIGELVIENATIQSPCFFNRVTIEGETNLATTIDGRIEFTGATFQDDFEMDQMTLNNYSLFDDCVFAGDADFYVDFNDEPHFTGSRFEGATDFFMDVNADSYFDDIVFRGPVSIYAEFNGDAYFEGTRFSDGLRCYGHFNVDALFADTVFEGAAEFRWQDADFDSVRFRGNTDFGAATFEEPVDFGKVEFIGGAEFADATFHAPATFEDARFQRPANFDGVQFADRLTFTGTEFDRRVTLAPIPAGDATTVSLTDADIAEGTIHITSPDVVYDTEGATLGEVRLEGTDEPFAHVRAVDTEFDGFDFSRHRQELARSEWTIHRVLDRDESHPPRRLEATYLKAKNGSTAAGENHAASEFFLRELRARRLRHRSDIGNDIRAPGRYLANLVMDVTCGYGEKPWRVIASSFAVILGFALVYAAVDVPLTTGDSLLRYVILSLETFVALVLGTPDVTRPVVNALTASEAFLGAYFIALFVFALTRSIHR